MKRFIDVSTWLYGEGPEASMLYRPSDGKQCCLGQWAITAGIPIEDITEITAPCVLIEHDLVESNLATAYFDVFVGDTGEITSSEYAADLMKCNDRKTDEHGQPMTLAMRMAAMAEIGDEHGDEIIFLNVPDEARCW